jgi:hypothetical protein
MINTDLQGFNLTGVTWVCRDDALCPSNVTAARESIIFDGMTICDMGQINSIPHQYGVYLDLILFNNPSMLQVSEAKTPLLKLNRHHPVFVLMRY